MASVANTANLVYVSPSHYTSLLSVVRVKPVEAPPAELSSSSSSDSVETISTSSVRSVQSPLDAFFPSFLKPLAFPPQSLRPQAESYVLHPYGSMPALLASPYEFRTTTTVQASGSSCGERRAGCTDAEMFVESQVANVPSLQVTPVVDSESAAREALRGILAASSDSSSSSQSPPSRSSAVLLKNRLIGVELHKGVEHAAQTLYKQRNGPKKRSRTEDDLNSAETKNSKTPPAEEEEGQDSTRGQQEDSNKETATVQQQDSPIDNSTKSQNVVSQASLLQLLWALTEPSRSPYFQWTVLNHIPKRAYRQQPGQLIFSLALSSAATSPFNVSASIKVEFPVRLRSATRHNEEALSGDILANAVGPSLRDVKLGQQQENSRIHAFVQNLYEVYFIKSLSTSQKENSTSVVSDDSDWVKWIAHGLIVCTSLAIVLQDSRPLALQKSPQLASSHKQKGKQQQDYKPHATKVSLCLSPPQSRTVVELTLAQEGEAEVEWRVANVSSRSSTSPAVSSFEIASQRNGGLCSQIVVSDDASATRVVVDGLDGLVKVVKGQTGIDDLKKTDNGEERISLAQLGTILH